MSSLASTYHEMGCYEEARTLHEKVLSKRELVLGDNHPDTLLSMSSLASTCHELGCYEEARALHEKVVDKQ
jgi:hypothetical protein